MWYFLLDPSRHSSLQLVKSCGATPGHGDSISVRDQGGTSVVTPGNFRMDLQYDRQERERDCVSHGKRAP